MKEALHAQFMQLLFNEYDKNMKKKGLSSGAFKNYVDKILDFFECPPSPLVDSFT